VTTLADLEELPAVVRELQQRVRELEARLLAAPANDNANTLLGASEVARLLGLTPRAVRQAAWRGAIPFVRVGRRLRFRRSQLPK
jgi:excisionase family DNA binding protein